MIRPLVASGEKPKELKLPTYQAQSPQIGMRRYFADLLAVLSNRYQLCPTARHLAVYLLDLFMDHYDVAVRQLYVIALSCLLLASKSHMNLIALSFAYLYLISAISPPHPPALILLFEEKEDRVPKLEQLNTLGFMCTLNLTLNKRDLIKMELLLLETFGWNLCMPTPAHFIDYYLQSFTCHSPKHHHGNTHETEIIFRPSQVAAACIAASRICLQISPSWTTVLHLLTGYSWDHLTQCIQLMLLAHDNDVKEANKSKSSPSASQSLHPQAHVPHSPATPSLQRQPASSSQQLLLQASSYPQLSQHSPALSQLHMLADCQALGPVGSREYLQPHQAGLLSASMPSFPSLASGLRGLPLQGPISMQVNMGPERHCLGLTYGSGYLSSHHTFTAGCFDR
uniref:Cyclin-J-like n=1 Tax=Sinocyclocheilus anshuiensis TaxID=1608454 RepID=A0A671MP08_9TELE